jgi:hypothetical protein
MRGLSRTPANSCPSIRTFAGTARRYRITGIQDAAYAITAADPLSGDLQEAQTKISNASAGAY